MRRPEKDIGPSQLLFLSGFASDPYDFTVLDTNLDTNAMIS
jgi:hypothetical protein